MQAMWTEFKEASGFNYGQRIGPEDMIARTHIVRLLNSNTQFVKRHMRAIPCADATGNSCRIVIVDNKDNHSDTILLSLLFAGKIYEKSSAVQSVLSTNDVLEHETIESIVSKAYAETYGTNDVSDEIEEYLDEDSGRMRRKRRTVEE